MSGFSGRVPPKITGEEATMVADEASYADPSSSITRAAGDARPSEALSSAPMRELVGGRYEVLGLVGAGGMGTVYRARDRELDELVALKVLRRDLAETPGILERFRQEAKLARRVTHRNVARTFDIGEHAGDKFLTMELVDGESLASRIAREGALPWSEVVRIALEIAAGLTAAHAAGVVHRDLKPDNVLLASDGRVVITDFGIARAVDALAPAATMGAPIGTPAYMAPEQVEGTTDIDARADVYALGTILYETLTGERAWPGEGVYGVAIARLTSPPPDPRARARAHAVSDAAAAIVQRCLARKRDDRYPSAESAAAAIRAVAAGAPDAAPPTLHSSEPNPRISTRPEPASKTLAVLPFRNAGKAEDEYLADGLTDDLIDALSMTAGLKVRSRGAVMRFKGGDRDPRDIGRELDVQVVVEGSVKKHGAKLRVSARVIGVADGFQLWAKRFDRSEEDFLSVGDEAANAIAAAVTVERAAPARAAPTDPVAIDLYLRARHLYHNGWRAEMTEAVRLFEDALARAPNDPMILAGYALAALRRVANDPDASDELCDVARAAAEKALAISPMLGSARVAIAHLHLLMGDGVACARALREAMQVAPHHGEVLDMRGRMLVEIGRPEQGIASLEEAIHFEPSLERAHADIIRAYALLDDWPRAEERLARAPAGDSALNLFGFMGVRLATWRRDKAMAARVLAWIGDRPFPLRPQVELMCALVIDGRVTPEMHGALAYYGRVTGRARRRPAFMRQIAAELYAYLGDLESSIVALESADALNLVDVVWLERCPVLAPLRETPRYRAVHARVRDRADRALAALEPAEAADANQPA